MPKNIEVFSDGTGQDGGSRPEQRTSNIYKMYRIAHDHPDNAIDPVLRRQSRHRHRRDRHHRAGAIRSETGIVMGSGIKRNIADCYEFIVNHYQPGDRIFLFGSAAEPTPSAASRTH
jgi:uncharacterized protein (DUF2235 family)